MRPTDGCTQHNTTISTCPTNQTPPSTPPRRKRKVDQAPTVPSSLDIRSCHDRRCDPSSDRSASPTSSHGPCQRGAKWSGGSLIARDDIPTATGSSVLLSQCGCTSRHTDLDRIRVGTPGVNAEGDPGPGDWTSVRSIPALKGLSLKMEEVVNASRPVFMSSSRCADVYATSKHTLSSPPFPTHHQTRSAREGGRRDIRPAVAG